MGMPTSTPRPAIVSSVIPLAVSGQIVIGVVVIGALLLLRVLLRSESRLEAEEERERRP
jgi:L-lactate permease